MSNPGVIKLTEDTIHGERFVVEDNIGEAIHIHFGNIRLDLTINEFMKLGKDAENALIQLLEIPEFSVERVDPILLTKLSNIILDLEKIERMEVPLSQLYVIMEDNQYIPLKLEEAAVRYKAVNENYEVSLFNDDNYIIGGADTAIQMYQQNHNGKIPVTRYYFKDKKHGFEYKKVLEQLERYHHCKEIIRNELEHLPLDAKIAFRGGGIHMEQIMREFPEGRDIECIIEKSAATNYNLEQCKVIPLSQINMIPFNTIIISSFGYRAEMRKELKDIFHGKIIDFYDLFQEYGYKFEKPYYMIKVFGKWVIVKE